MISTPLPTNPGKEKEFILVSDNKEYKVKIYILSDIVLEINEISKITCSIYTNNFSLEYLAKLSKGFRICDNVNEAYEIIASIIDGKKLSLIVINDNEISLILKVELPGGKTEDVKLNLYKKEINKDKLIEELIKKINQLEEKKKILKMKLLKLKKNKKNLKIYLCLKSKTKK